MQTVAAGWTAEERDSVRSIVQNTQISWHKDSTLGNRTFTIGVSTIGGSDVIGANAGAIGSPSNYRYFDESDYVTSLGWERGLNMPLGGLTKALAEAKLDNTSGRFTPRFMGGNSEIYTAIQAHKPIIINAGFNLSGVDQMLPQFAGLINKQPSVNIRNREVSIQAGDYMEYFQSKSLDQQVMFTAQRTDQVLASILSTAGMSTAQYDLDTGLNTIPFGIFESGSKLGNVINDLVAAENGHFYQDESGIFKFENRQHWYDVPYTDVQRIILTSQVISQSVPNFDHLINVVEVKSAIMAKQPSQLLFQLSTPLAIPANTDTSLFVNFDNPVLQMQDVTGYSAFVNSDGTGTDITTSVTVKATYVFANSAKIIFTNSSSSSGYITQLYLYGRPAKKTSDLYYRIQDSSSVTAYDEHVVTINNPYIQDETWAQSYANLILTQFAELENLQVITIRAIPELQLGDLISWQGHYWRVYNIKASLSPSEGFIQELDLLQRNVIGYFKIGISTIGGTDAIAP